jgi:hypothetical protein
MRHRDIANYSEVIRVRPRTDIKGQSAPSRMSLQSSRPALSLEKRPEIHAESTKVPLINEAVSGAAKTIALNGIPQMLHSWDPTFAGICYRARDSQRAVRGTKLEDVGVHAV